MNIVRVQKWMAHASPEMTLVYARILDGTLRKEWERAFKGGAVRIDGLGNVRRVSAEDLLDENEVEMEWIRHNLDAVRLPKGYCFKPKNAVCHAQTVPCYTCRRFCTTVEFLPQLELERKETEEMSARGRAQGMRHWVEKNEEKCRTLIRIIGTLREGKTHYPPGKADRERMGEERRDAKPRHVGSTGTCLAPRALCRAESKAGQ